MEHRWNTQNLETYLYIYKKPQQNKLFYGYKALKNKSDRHSIIIFFILYFGP